MHATVILHMVAQLERFAAELALERPVAGVHRQVRDQRRHVRKAFTTELAQHHVARVAGTVRRHRVAADAAQAAQAAQATGAAHSAHRCGRCGRRGRRKLNVHGGRSVRLPETVQAERLRRRAAAAAASARAGNAAAKVQVVRGLAVLERIQRVRQNVARQFALVRKRGAAVYALE